MSKNTTKTATEKTPAPKTGLRTPQLRILAALSKTKAPLTRKEVAEKAECDQAGLTEWIGSSDSAKRRANDTRYFPSLLTLGLVTAEEKEGEPTVFTITASGRKALTTAK